MFDVLSKLGWFFKILEAIYGGHCSTNGCQWIRGCPSLFTRFYYRSIDSRRNDPTILTKYVLIFIGIIIGGYVLNFVWQFRLFEGAINLEKILRRNLMQRFLRMTPTFYEKTVPVT